MKGKLIIIGVFLALMGVNSWLSYQWGQSVCAAEGEQERAVALSDAINFIKSEYYHRREIAEDLAEKEREKAKERLKVIRELEKEISEYSRSEAGKEACWDEEGLRRFNDL